MVYVAGWREEWLFAAAGGGLVVMEARGRDIVGCAVGVVRAGVG